MSIIHSVLLISSIFELVHTAENAPEATAPIARARERSTAGRKWISEMMADAERDFEMRVNVSAECRRDFETYKLHARNQTVWAIRMLESSEWPRVGLFSGVTTHAGHYAACLRARGPGIKGQYCVVQATYDFNVSISNRPAPGWNRWPEENASAWEVIETEDKNPFRRSRRSLNWAMCIPSSCTAAELQTSLGMALGSAFAAQGLEITERVDPRLCKVEGVSRSLENPNILALSNASQFIGVLLLLMALSTIYDLVLENDRVPGEATSWLKLIKCFSAVQNCKSLTQCSPTNTYMLLYFLKVLCMVVILWTHSMMIYYMFPKFETEEMEMAFAPWSLELLGPTILNAFFMMSGFLKAFHFNFSPAEDGSVRFFARSFALKWLRLMPANGLLILCSFFLLPYLEDGPLIRHLKLEELKHCSSNWWINLLALQNLVNYREICHPHSWYIAVDMQLFVLGTVLLIVTKRNRKHGIYLTTLVFLYSVHHTFAKIYWHGSGRLFTEFYTIDLMNFKETLSTLMAIHTITFLRVGPYLVGHVTALLTEDLMEKGYKFSRMQSMLLLVCSCLIGFGFPLYGFLFYMVDRQSSPLEAAAFGVLQPILFVLPFASLICVYFTSGLGILKRFFELKFCIPIGRLAYSVYLVGYCVQSHHVFNQKRSLPSFSRIEIYWWIVGDVFFVLLFAFLFYLTCEGPLNGIINAFIAPHLVKKKKTRTSKED